MSHRAQTQTSGPARREQYSSLAPLYRRLLLEAKRIVSSPADAEDIVQDCFVRALESDQAGRGPANLQAWLTIAVRHRSIDVLRSRCRQRLGAVNVAHDPERAQCPEQDQKMSVAIEQLRCAIQEIPRVSQQLIELRYVEQLTYRQLAMKLDLSAKAVGVRLHRARSLLRILLAQHNEAG